MQFTHIHVQYIYHDLINQLFVSYVWKSNGCPSFRTFQSLEMLVHTMVDATISTCLIFRFINLSSADVQQEHPPRYSRTKKQRHWVQHLEETNSQIYLCQKTDHEKLRTLMQINSKRLNLSLNEKSKNDQSLSVDRNTPNAVTAPARAMRTNTGVGAGSGSPALCIQIRTIMIVQLIFTGIHRLPGKMNNTVLFH